jgi:hypothetical protein
MDSNNVETVSYVNSSVEDLTCDLTSDLTSDLTRQHLVTPSARAFYEFNNLHFQFLKSASRC